MCMYKFVTKEIVLHITRQLVIFSISIPLFGCLHLTDCWFRTSEGKAKNNTPVVTTLERFMSFLNRSVSPGQQSNLPMASNCEIELQENHPIEAEDKLSLTKKETEATIDGQEQLNSVSNGNMSNGGSLLQTADEKSDASQGQRLYRVALLAMCFVSAVSLGLTLLMLFGVFHVGSPQCTCSGETGICRFTNYIQCYHVQTEHSMLPRSDWNIVCGESTIFFPETHRPQELIYVLWSLFENFSVALFSKWQIDRIVSSFYNYWESKDVKNVQTEQKSIRGVSGKHNPEKLKILKTLRIHFSR